MKSNSSLSWEFGAIPMIEPEYLGGILATSSDIALLIDMDCTIHSVLLNSPNESYGDLSHWETHPLTKFLAPDSLPKLDKALKRLQGGETILYGLELNHKDNAKWKFPVRYNFHCLGTHNKILMLGRDLRGLSETQQRLVQAQLAVEKSNEERREFDAHFKMLMKHTTDPIAFINADSGTILHCNQALADMFGSDMDDLSGTKFQSRLLKSAEKRDFVERLSLAAQNNHSIVSQFECNGHEQDLELSCEIYRTAGQKVLMCKILTDNDVSTSDDTFISNLISVFHNSSDAMVFTDAKGKIHYTNERFLDLVNVGQKKDVVAHSLADFLGRGQIDLAVMLENVLKSGSVRTYATHLKSAFGSKIKVETSVSKNQASENALIAFILRETSKFDATAPSQQGSSPQVPRDEGSAKDLVGNATLKEIVSETTDVIEKICIETALEMTNNNRAAAAEMLGLSRQSLYVKLSKFDI